MYDSILSVLRDPRNTALETAQFRFWTKKMFTLIVTDSGPIVVHENRPGPFCVRPLDILDIRPDIPWFLVAVKEQIYDVLVSVSPPRCRSRRGEIH
jgi:hypothetical protein